jgi:hypothetical protein
MASVASSVEEICLICGVKTTAKDRRAVDFVTQSRVAYTIKRFYRGRLKERRKLCPDIETVFSSKCWLCRKCHSSLSTFCDKETAFLGKIDKILDSLRLEDSDDDDGDDDDEYDDCHDESRESFVQAGKKRPCKSRSVSRGGKSSTADVQIQINYSRPRTFHLQTPKRRRLAAYLCKGQPSSVAKQCFQHPLYQKEVIKLVGRVIQKEIVKMSTEKSILRSTDASILQQFRWEYVAKEAKMHAPILYMLLKTIIAKEDKEHMILLIISMLCHLKRRNMNLHLKLVSCILYAGHCTKRVSFVM